MSIAEKFNYYFYEVADDRVADWFWYRSLWPISTTIFIYVLFVFYLGPRYMKDRAAYELKTFIKVYNIFQVITNAYIVKELLSVYPDGTAFRCVLGDYSRNPGPMRVSVACNYVVWLKVIDLSETAVYVLRKKKNQISFLHLYHHITTAIIALLYTKYIATGMSVFFPILNCSVHVIMYTYFFFSSMDSPIKEMTLQFKKYITIIQMVQFVMLIIHASIAMLPSCAYPTIPALIMIPNVLMNFNLFYKFYKKNYLNTTKKRE